MKSPADVRDNMTLLLGQGLSVPFYPYEPFSAPTMDFVTMFLDGYDANFWNVTVRIYVPYATIGAEAAQQRVEQLMPEVEDTLSAQYGPVQWTVLPNLEQETLEASWPLQVGREDF